MKIGRPLEFKCDEFELFKFCQAVHRFPVQMLAMFTV